MMKLVPVKEAARKVERHYTQLYTAIKKGKLHSYTIDGLMKVDLHQTERLFNPTKSVEAKPKLSKEEWKARHRERTAHLRDQEQAEREAEENAKAAAAAALPPALNALPVVEELRTLDSFMAGRFGKYAPPLAQVVKEAVALVIADMEGRVSVREQEPA